MISSRTPEGSPNTCPICGHDLRIEPSLLTRDAPCPSCGHLLWFADSSLPATDLSADLAARKELQESVLQALADQLNVSVDELKKNPALLSRLQGADSLDTVELVMEMENFKP